MEEDDEQAEIGRGKLTFPQVCFPFHVFSFLIKIYSLYTACKQTVMTCIGPPSLLGLAGDAQNHGQGRKRNLGASSELPARGRRLAYLQHDQESDHQERGGLL